jgi:hypothetical protein
MTISTATSQAAVPSLFGRSLFYALCLLLPGIVIVRNAAETAAAKRKNLGLGFVMLLLLMFGLLSCGGVSNGGGSTGGGVPTTYQITITGTSAGTPADSGQSAVVTLVVN